MRIKTPTVAKLARLFCALIIALAANLTAIEPADARTPKKQKQAAKAEPVPFTVEIPESELQVSGRLEAPLATKPVRVELAASRFEPSNFSRPGYGGAQQKFHAGSAPFLSLNRSTGLVKWNNGVGAIWRIGASYSGLERDARVNIGGVSLSSEQTLNLVSLRIGLGLEGPRFANQTLAPYIGFHALPTYVLGSQSQLENRVSALGLPFEAIAGLSFQPKFLREFLSVYDGAFGLGAQAIFGTIDNSRMNGLALQGTFSARL